MHKVHIKQILVYSRDLLKMINTRPAPSVICPAIFVLYKVSVMGIRIAVNRVRVISLYMWINDGHHLAAF